MQNLKALEDFLFEIGTEELPPKSLLTLSQSLEASVKKQLKEAQLSHGKVESFATPRRLAILIHKLSTQQPMQAIERKGPSLKATLDRDGNPTKALHGFLKSCGCEYSELTHEETPKGTWLFYHAQKAGKKADQLLLAIIATALKQLPVGKMMRWGDHDYQFVRPVKWTLMMLGSQVIDAEFYGQKTANVSYGHPVMAPEAITLDQPNQYQEKLKEAKVIPSLTERHQMIESQLDNDIPKKNNHALLNEVSALVEYPVLLTGQFDKRIFDTLPA